MNISGVSIGPDQPCRIVAEISNNHNGEVSNVVRLVRECTAAGADFVKFQCFVPDELVALRGAGPAPDPWGSEGWSMLDLYEKAQTPHAWFPFLDDLCKVESIPWFSSVFGPESLALLESLDCPAYKIAALDTQRDWVARTWERFNRKPVLASIRANQGTAADFALHCPEGYPQTEGYDPSVAPGFSYHGKGVGLIEAIEAGAQMIEVHVQLDDVPSELEADVSLNVSQLAMLCDQVKG